MSDTINYMYGYELLAHPLNIDLVVLSACESGAGQLDPSEGVLSLGRSFLQAGASAVVSSLWKQVDFSAEKIQTHFYGSLKDGSTISESLQQAKVNYLNSANRINAHPSYWAGIRCFSFN